MKFVATIIAIYVLALTVAPCPDVPDDSTLHKTENTQKEADHHHNDIDHCSPFCSCSCCATSIVHYYFYYDLSCLFFSNKVYTIYTPDFNSFISTSIWQPPKLS